MVAEEAALEGLAEAAATVVAFGADAEAAATAVAFGADAVDRAVAVVEERRAGEAAVVAAAAVEVVARAVLKKWSSSRIDTRESLSLAVKRTICCSHETWCRATLSTTRKRLAPT